MRDYIRRLPWQIEFVIILALAFGWMMPSTLHSMRALATAGSAITLVSDASQWRIIRVELVFLSVMTPILYLRGWTFGRLGIRPSLWGCLIGAFLALIAYGMYFQLSALLHHFRLAVHGRHVD
jgi:hypothetical protein